MFLLYMKNLLIGIAVGIIMGIGIGYLIWGRTSQSLINDLKQNKLSKSQQKEIFDYLVEVFAVKLEFGSSSTDFIERHIAKDFVNLFGQRFCSPSGPPLYWDKQQTSWRVDGNKLRAILNQTVKGDTTKIIESVLFEMGINPKNPTGISNQVTLIISGLEKDNITGDRYKVMGKTDVSRWGIGLGKREHSDPSRDYILEYVDPCIPPPCPRNSF